MIKNTKISPFTLRAVSSAGFVFCAATTIFLSTFSPTTQAQNLEQGWFLSNNSVVYCNGVADKERWQAPNGNEYVSYHYAFDAAADPKHACTSNITNMSAMLWVDRENFNEPLNHWDTSNVTDMSYMFYGAKKFNQPLNNWDMSNVISTEGMFGKAENFNQQIDGWNTESLVNTAKMFFDAKSFDQALNRWDTSKAVNMNSMFKGASNFNKELSGWDVSSAKLMFDMFRNADSFNQDLSSWDVSNVDFIMGIFYDAQSLSFNPKWDVSGSRGAQCLDYGTVFNPQKPTYYCR